MWHHETTVHCAASCTTVHIRYAPFVADVALTQEKSGRLHFFGDFG